MWKKGLSMPAFLAPQCLKLLADTFNIQLITTPAEDIEACLAEAQGTPMGVP